MIFRLTIILVVALAISVAALAQSAPVLTPDPDAFYQLGPDSLPQGGVPKGEIRGPFALPSSAYPGTQHTYWVYVPAQYDAAVPASLMIYNDGQAFMNPDGDMRAQNVMDNLIFRRELPVMIGVFINPGRRPDQPEPNASEWGDHTTAITPQTGQRNTTLSTTNTHASSSTNSCLPFTRTTTSQKTRSGAGSADRVPARSPRSRLLGSG